MGFASELLVGLVLSPELTVRGEHCIRGHSVLAEVQHSKFVENPIGWLFPAKQCGRGKGRSIWNPPGKRELGVLGPAT